MSPPQLLRFELSDEFEEGIDQLNSAARGILVSSPLFIQLLALRNNRADPEKIQNFQEVVEIFEKICDDLCAEKEQEIENRKDAKPQPPTAPAPTNVTEEPELKPTQLVPPQPEQPPLKPPQRDPPKEEPKIEQPKVEAPPEPLHKKPQETIVTDLPAPVPVPLKPTPLPLEISETISVPQAGVTRRRENARAAMVLPTNYEEKQQKEKQHQKEISHLNPTPLWLVKLQEKRCVGSILTLLNVPQTSEQD